jgi:hypothetical protein
VLLCYDFGSVRDDVWVRQWASLRCNARTAVVTKHQLVRTR